MFSLRLVFYFVFPLCFLGMRILGHTPLPIRRVGKGGYGGILVQLACFFRVSCVSDPVDLR
jgi:hypothetical protein